MTWADGAACKDMPKADFFQTRRGVGYTAAAAVCAACPVRDDCLADCLAWERANGGYRHGFWAGTTPRDRARIVGGRPKAKHGERARYLAGCHCADCCEANTAYIRKWRLSA